MLLSEPFQSLPEQPWKALKAVVNPTYNYSSLMQGLRCLRWHLSSGIKERQKGFVQCVTRSPTVATRSIVKVRPVINLLSAVTQHFFVHVNFTNVVPPGYSWDETPNLPEPPCSR
jgi:hypothetical protein